MLVLPGDPQAGGFVRESLSPLAAAAPTAARVLLGSVAFVLGACAAQPWNFGEAQVQRNPPPVTAPGPVPDPEVAAPAAVRGLLLPVAGVVRGQVVDSFDHRRGLRRHNAVDIMAPRGTPVLAAAEGEIAKMYRHPLGGISLYQYDTERRFSYYYAHLDAYAAGLREGMVLKRGDPVGFVGTTGNATAGAPHLHFAVIELGPDRKWWKGKPVNPLPLFE